MTTRTPAVVSAGPSVPSSTRLPADLVAHRPAAAAADPFATATSFEALLRGA